MSAAPKFTLKGAEQRLGPAAMEAADRVVAAAPPFSPELREQLRALFASAHTAPPRPATKAA